MPTRVRRVVTAIDRNGNSFSEVHTETGQGNEWKENDPVPLDEAGPEAAKWKADYSASVIAERNKAQADRDKNKADKDKLVEDHATEKATLQQNHAAEIVTLQQQHSTALNDLQTQLNTKQAELDLSVAAVNALTAEREQLLAELELLKNPPTTPHHQFMRLMTPEELRSFIDALVGLEVLTGERADTIIEQLS